MHRRFRIRLDRDDEGEALYWNNRDGWGDRASATRFTWADTRTVTLPSIGTPCHWDPRPPPTDDGALTSLAAAQLTLQTYTASAQAFAASFDRWGPRTEDLAKPPGC